MLMYNFNYSRLVIINKVMNSSQSDSGLQKVMCLPFCSSALKGDSPNRKQPHRD